MYHGWRTSRNGMDPPEGDNPRIGVPTCNGDTTS